MFTNSHKCLPLLKIFVFIVTDAYNHEVALQLQLCSFTSNKNQISVFRVSIFISNLLRTKIFIFIQLQHRPFILRYSLFEFDGYRIFHLISIYQSFITIKSTIIICPTSSDKYYTYT